MNAPVKSAEVLPHPRTERRGQIPDRRSRSTDRRGLIADRRQAKEARYRATADARLQARHATWQERERQRISADLHDSIGSSLCTIRLKIQEVMATSDGGMTGAVRALLKRVLEDVGHSMEEVRRIAIDLRPSIIDDLGIIATLNWLSRELEDAHGGIRVDKDIRARESEIPSELKTTMFRIAQEALSNALKHSGARHVRVSLHQDEHEFGLSVMDDGKGFELLAVLDGHGLSPHFGIANMRQRANGSGGTLSIRSEPGGGTLVRCIWTKEPAA